MRIRIDRGNSGPVFTDQAKRSRQFEIESSAKISPPLTRSPYGSRPLACASTAELQPTEICLLSVQVSMKRAVMAYLIEILLPTTDPEPLQYSIGGIREELTERFGGATFHLNAPAEGFRDD